MRRSRVRDLDQLVEHAREGARPSLPDRGGAERHRALEQLQLHRWLELLESPYDYGYRTVVQPNGNVDESDLHLLPLIRAMWMKGRRVGGAGPVLAVCSSLRDAARRMQTRTPWVAHIML